MKVGTDGILLGAWADVAGARRILDVGCGSGLIALMLAQRNSAAAIDAIDVDEPSWQQAVENVQRSPWPERVEVIHQSVQQFSKTHEKSYDLVASNPPFFSGGTFSASQSRNEVRQTVKLPHGELLAAMRRLLNSAGRFCVILPLIEGLRLEELAVQYGLHCTSRVEVQPHQDKPVHRLLMQFELAWKAQKEGRLIIQKRESAEYTDAFIQLTKDYYLGM